MYYSTKHTRVLLTLFVQKRATRLSQIKYGGLFKVLQFFGVVYHKLENVRPSIALISNILI